MKHVFWKYLLVCVLALAIAAGTPLTVRNASRPNQPRILRCAIDLQGEQDPKSLYGLNQFILGEFATDYGIDLSFLSPADSTSFLDSLREGTVDVLVTYRADSLHADGLMSTHPYLDSTLCVLREDEGIQIRRLNNWIQDVTENGRIQRMSRSYFRRMNSHRITISPYDTLIKIKAAEIGWDWRLLSALIYHESRFKNEAHSNKGAVGLMQIISPRYSRDTLLIPSVNLTIGTRYLNRLEGMFARQGADSLECLKFTLAAYNAGEGTILKCIRTAERLGVDASRWNNIVSIFPQMPDFSGKQTTAYVREILNKYEEYSDIYPD